MPETTVDAEALYAALDQKRQAEDLSWRELARKLRISPSTFTRLAQRRRPDIDTFATLIKWLGMHADMLMRSSTLGRQEAEPLAMISAYLRSARNIRPEEAEALEDILRAAYKRLKREE